jgi:hypothetical protein
MAIADTLLYEELISPTLLKKNVTSKTKSIPMSIVPTECSGQEVLYAYVFCMTRKVWKNDGNAGNDGDEGNELLEVLFP